MYTRPVALKLRNMLRKKMGMDDEIIKHPLFSLEVYDALVKYKNNARIAPNHMFEAIWEVVIDNRQSRDIISKTYESLIFNPDHDVSREEGSLMYNSVGMKLSMAIVIPKIFFHLTNVSITEILSGMSIRDLLILAKEGIWSMIIKDISQKQGVVHIQYGILNKKYLR